MEQAENLSGMGSIGAEQYRRVVTCGGDGPAVLNDWAMYGEIAREAPKYVAAFRPCKPSRSHYTTLNCGTSDYHLALLIHAKHDKIGIEFYAPDNKEVGHKAIDNAAVFEERLGLEATIIDGKKASGVRFWKEGCKIEGNEGAWPEFIRRQLAWALEMKKIVAELGLQALWHQLGWTGPAPRQSYASAV